MKGIAMSRVSLGVVAFLLSLSTACAEMPQGQHAPTPPTTFQECVAQQGQVLKSYPARCVSADGKTFVDSDPHKEGSERACIDLCGEGRCQEIVCMAVGCPCAESHATCPKDCQG